MPIKLNVAFGLSVAHFNIWIVFHLRIIQTTMMRISKILMMSNHENKFLKESAIGPFLENT